MQKRRNSIFGCIILISSLLFVGNNFQMESLIQTVLEFSNALGYWGIVLLMTIESSFIPFPSEIIIPPAAYLAYKGEMNLWLVIGSGVLGSVIGACINYGIARWLGRPAVYAIAKRRYMKYLLITHHKLHKAEKFFLKYGNISTFVGRLIFGVRQLVSLPAGFVKMPFWPFVFFTALGATVWIPFLAMHGYLLGAHEEWVRAYFSELSIGFGVVAALVALGLFWWKRGRRKKC